MVKRRLSHSLGVIKGSHVFWLSWTFNILEILGLITPRMIYILQKTHFDVFLKFTSIYTNFHTITKGDYNSTSDLHVFLQCTIMCSKYTTSTISMSCSNWIGKQAKTCAKKYTKLTKNLTYMNFKLKKVRMFWTRWRLVLSILRLESMGMGVKGKSSRLQWVNVKCLVKGVSYLTTVTNSNTSLY